MLFQYNDNVQSQYALTSKCSNMSSILQSYPLHSLKHEKMAIPFELPEHVICDGTVSNKLHQDFDVVDNPQPQKNVSVEEEKLFQTMKYEINRLNSYSGKWPLRYIKPADLAETGLFYLQSEDAVQCAFCQVIIDDWNVGQKPLKEHMKKSPKCPFLMTCDVGNVSISRSKSTMQGSQRNFPMNNMSSSKPKYPKMAEIKNRLTTYKDWPRIMLSPKQLAECGLYYTGVADVVTCFFCGGSLGNWELDDDPWVEHQKFFPSCSYLRLIRNHRRSNKVVQNPVPESSVANATLLQPSDPLQSEIIRQACVIFPRSLVEKAVSQHFIPNGQRITSIQDVCDVVLHQREQEIALRMHSQQMKMEVKPEASPIVSKLPLNETNETANRKEIKDVLLCKICMDQEMGVVFQPCGHLVSCPKCAMLIFNCPLCRTPVTNKVRTYLS